MKIISVDLASGDYNEIGLVVIERLSESVAIIPIQLTSVGLRGRPQPSDLAAFLVSFAEKLGALAIGLDGPQGWKDAANGYLHSRVCEAKLGTQGKTGLPGMTKPATYLGFIQFCIDTFDELAGIGWTRLRENPATGGGNAVETFPTAAWKAMGLRPLPGKRRAKDEQIRTWTESLLQLGAIELGAPLSHDELQAAIAGLGILALAEQRQDGYDAVGEPPFEREGLWFEGYIVNPQGTAAAV